MKTQGFTLMELLIILGILAILLAISAPSLFRFLQNTRANEAASTAAAGLRQAVGNALTRSEEVTVSLADSNTALAWSNAGGTLKQKTVLPHAGVFTTIQPSSTITINGRGLPTEQYTLTLKTADVTRTVILMVTGKVTTP